MAALRRVRIRTGARRALLAGGLAVAVVGAVAGCEPLDGQLNSVAVSLTTDQTGTRELHQHGVDVQWLSCSATVGEVGKATISRGPSPSVRSVATVDCEGETKGGKDITITGKVTEERAGRCVRGDLTAKVGGQVAFRANVLGNCNAPPSRTPPVTFRPPSHTPGAIVTVTTTVTVRPDPDATCTTGFPGK